MDGPSSRTHALRDELIRRGLRLPQLRLIVALQDTGQVSGAAAHMAMTQPAASRLLAELERTVDARLYERHPRGVTLTPAGEAFAARARDVLYRLDQAQHEIAALTSGVRGPVRLGSVTGPAVELVLPVIRELRTSYPEIQLSIEVTTSDKLADSLLAGDLDFYIGRVPDGVDARPFTLEQIAPEPLTLVSRLGHPLLERPAIGIADCLEFDWVLQPEGSVLRRAMDDYLMKRGYRPPERIVSTSSMLMTLAIVCETDAITPIALSTAHFYTSEKGFGGRIRQLDVARDMVVLPYSLVGLRDREVSPAMLRVIDLIRRRIQGPVDEARAVRNTGAPA